MAARRSNAQDRHSPTAPSLLDAGRAGIGDSVEVVRSEERMRVATEVTVTGRAVLRKYIVTEIVTQTFEVRHEEVRLHYEPATTPDPSAPSGPVFDDRVVEVILHREVPTVQMQVVPTERVRLHVDTTTERVEVAADLRKEQIDLDTDLHAAGA